MFNTCLINLITWWMNEVMSKWTWWLETHVSFPALACPRCPPARMMQNAKTPKRKPNQIHLKQCLLLWHLQECADSSRAPAREQRVGCRGESPPQVSSQLLTQLHARQLRDVPQDGQEVGTQSPVGVQEQEAQFPVPPVSVLHAVLRGHVEAPLWGGNRSRGWGPPCGLVLRKPAKMVKTPAEELESPPYPSIWETHWNWPSLCLIIFQIKAIMIVITTLDDDDDHDEGTDLTGLGQVNVTPSCKSLSLATVRRSHVTDRGGSFSQGEEALRKTSEVLNEEHSAEAEKNALL